MTPPPFPPLALQNLLSQHSAPGSSSCSASFHQSEPASAGQQEEAPRSALSPLTNSLLEQLEARIKELKAWLRDTELLIFNSCLGRDKEASEQLASFKVPSPALPWSSAPQSSELKHLTSHNPPLHRLHPRLQRNKSNAKS